IPRIPYFFMIRLDHKYWYTNNFTPSFCGYCNLIELKISSLFDAIIPQKSRDVFEDMFDRKDPVTRFEIDPGYGHLKIFVKNRGRSTITFSLVHKDSGKLYITKTVGAGKSLQWNNLDSFSQGLRSGNYEMQWRAGGDIE
ncbi:hypothetical protein ACI1P2_29080, partial [Paenibacillus sp. p-8]